MPNTLHSDSHDIACSLQCHAVPCFSLITLLLLTVSLARCSCHGGVIDARPKRKNWLTRVHHPDLTTNPQKNLKECLYQNLAAGSRHGSCHGGATRVCCACADLASGHAWSKAMRLLRRSSLCQKPSQRSLCCSSAAPSFVRLLSLPLFGLNVPGAPGFRV